MPPPRVFRRTPASEKAAIYGYKDLLRDSLVLLEKRATANIERMTSGKMSEGEVLEMALAPAGGMLKMAGTGKLLAGMLAREAGFIERARAEGFTKHDLSSLLRQYRTSRGVFKEALKVPEKEYGRIKDIRWGSMARQPLGTRGFYEPLTKKIQLRPGLEDIGTIWHEFTHARQWTPEKGEEITSRTLRLLNEELSRRSGLSGHSHFYHQISPIEKHARNVAMTMTTGSKPSEFSKVYKGLLELASAEAEMRVGPQQARDFGR